MLGAFFRVPYDAQRMRSKSRASDNPSYTGNLRYYVDSVGHDFSILYDRAALPTGVQRYIS